MTARAELTGGPDSDGRGADGLGADAAGNFDRLAGLYRWMEWGTFGPWLGRCRRAFLDELADARTALVLGDGDGRFTAALLAENERVEVDAVDASAGMLKALKRRAGRGAGRVRAWVADARRWEPDRRGYDLVATHFFLDCLTTDEVRALAARMGPALRPGAAWVVSEFAVPDGVYGRVVARPLVALLYLAFRVMTGLRVRRLPEHVEAMEEAGFVLRARRRWLGGLLVAEKWADGSRKASLDG
ncbi:MAG TPA: methyltransferase domain-containing protein [Terracidiphilus sp.]|nr:methyltransferase domain-containing protein [Terracidiphilus sp.]